VSLVVEAVGPQALVQDAGRPGHAHLGVTRSGAADLSSMRLGNRLVGNAESTACLEVLLGGLELRAVESVTVALTGAVGPVEVDGRPVGPGEALVLPAGARLRIDRPVQGLRTYVCVAGGVDVEPVLGSRATDTLSRIGPPPLEEGSLLPVGRHHGEPARVTAPIRLPDAELVLRVRPGPRDDWFTRDARRLLDTVTWRVSDRVDRVGTRLTGPALERGREGELPSEGCVRGSVQVSADGLPTVLGADHPVTGGYPVIACLDELSSDRLAQARPGTAIRFATLRSG
jgi:biotin-dependent carboxylase-like uncharacterized protein